MSVRCEPLGEAALRIALPDGIDLRAVLQALRTFPKVTDAVVTERHACVYFDPLDPPDDPSTVLAALTVLATTPPKSVTIRARYDGADLSDLALRQGLSVDEVVAIHTAGEYTVRVVGFLPGFAYLGDVDPRIAAPRHASPRPRVAGGSIGIAGRRTGVYPFVSPGGWQLIATAVDFRAFDPGAGSVLQIGDRVRFEAAP